MARDRYNSRRQTGYSFDDDALNDLDDYVNQDTTEEDGPIEVIATTAARTSIEQGEVVRVNVVVAGIPANAQYSEYVGDLVVEANSDMEWDFGEGETIYSQPITVRYQQVNVEFAMTLDNPGDYRICAGVTNQQPAVEQ